MWQAFFFRALLIPSVLCAGLVGCAQRQLVSQSSQFNRATAQSASSEILLNAARASKDFPLVFTGLTQYIAGNRVNGGVGFRPDFPFGFQALEIFNFNPSLDWSYNPGVQSINYGDLNTAQGLAGIKAPITFDDIQIYYESSASVPWQLLVALTTQVIQVTDELAAAVIDHSETFCSNNRDDRCRFIRQAASKCGWQMPFKYQGRQFVRYFNSPLTECSHLQFQAFYLALTLAGFSSELVTIDVESNIIKKEARAYFSVDHVQSIYKSQQGLRKDIGVGPLVFKTRSPKGMIEYLGDIIRVENFAAKPYVPTVLTSRGETPISVIEVGSRAQRAVLRVKDDEGVFFSVPEPDYSHEDHLTLKTISIISDFYHAAINKNALPEAGNIVFTSGAR